MKLQIIVIATAFLFAGCRKENIIPDQPMQTSNSVIGLTTPDHIVFVWFENKKYSSIIGNASAPYINSLVARGTLFTQAYAVTHPSLPNYLAFFSGTTRVTTDACISTLYQDKLDLGHQLYPLKFAWYNEGMPSAGSHVCTSGYYVRKHNPIASWGNISPTYSVPFTTFPTDFTLLPPVACVSPNMINDMHDGTIAQGDAWFKLHFSALIDWSMTHNSIVVFYTDENDGSTGNQIAVIAVGQHVKVNYKHATRIDHYSWLKTTLDMFGKPSTWTTNISTKADIAGCWQ